MSRADSPADSPGTVRIPSVSREQDSVPHAFQSATPFRALSGTLRLAIGEGFRARAPTRFSDGQPPYEEGGRADAPGFACLG